jgi:hypothetical protein
VLLQRGTTCSRSKGRIAPPKVTQHNFPRSSQRSQRPSQGTWQTSQPCFFTRKRPSQELWSSHSKRVGEAWSLQISPAKVRKSLSIHAGRWTGQVFRSPGQLSHIPGQVYGAGFHNSPGQVSTSPGQVSCQVAEWSGQVCQACFHVIRQVSRQVSKSPWQVSRSPGYVSGQVSRWSGKVYWADFHFTRAGFPAGLQGCWAGFRVTWASHPGRFLGGLRNVPSRFTRQVSTSSGQVYEQVFRSPWQVSTSGQVSGWSRQVYRAGSRITRAGSRASFQVIRILGRFPSHPGRFPGRIRNGPGRCTGQVATLPTLLIVLIQIALHHL